MSFLLVDHILAANTSERIQGIKHIQLNDLFLQRDNANRPIYTPALIGEAIGQLAAWQVMYTHDFQLRPVAGIAEKAWMGRPVYAGEQLLLTAWIDTLDDVAVAYHGAAHIQDEIIFSLEGAIGPLLPMTTFIDEHTVRSQFQRLQASPTEHRPAATAIEDPLSHPLTFDHILTHQPGQRLVAEKTIPMDTPYFPDHFPKKPVLPFTILLACIQNLVPHFRPGYTLTNCTWYKMKMKEFVRPGDTIVSALTLKSHTDTHCVLQCQTTLADKRICTLELHGTWELCA